MPVSTFELRSLDGTNGFSLSGLTLNSGFGASVSDAGDINGDGFSDIIIGSPLSSSFSGASYVVFGDASPFPATIDVATLDGSNGFVINGTANNLLGGSVSGAGDINGDGFDDLLVGAYGASSAYLIFGQNTGFAASVDVATLDGSTGFSISGVAIDDFTGFSVSNAGDVNNDTYDDIIIGAYLASPNGRTYAGASYVVFGQAGGFLANLDLSALDGNNGFALAGASNYDGSGRAVSSAGDVNGDGFDDVFIGASEAPQDGYARVGEGYVVFGQASGFPATVDLGTLDGTNGFAIQGLNPNDRTTDAISDAGDINGDGFDDLIFSAPYAEVDGNLAAGKSYVLFGQASGFSATIDLTTLDGTNGFVINGANLQDLSGNSVSSAGDFNGDGFDDLLIGVPFADPNGLLSGQSYLIFGKAGGFAANLELDALTEAEGLAINGVIASDISGSFVSGAGDVNNDGFADLLISSPNAAAGFGTSYVVFGFSTPQLSVNDLSIAEGDSSTTEVVFEIILAGTASETVSVDYTTVDDTATIANNDYTAIAGTVTFAVGETSQTVTVQVIGDTNIEPDETFQLVLSNPQGATVADSTGLATIENDDIDTGLDDLSVTVDDVFVTEAESATTTATFTVSLANTFGNDIGLNYQIADGTATAGNDYTSASGIVTIAAGSSTATITVDILSDNEIEPDETFTLTLSDLATAAVLTSGEATIRSCGSTTAPTPCDDILSGTDADDVILALAGDDIVRGRSGNDQLLGQDGNDTLIGQTGDDTLRGGDGKDLLIGGGGADKLVGQNDNDTLRGLNGNDLLNGGNGNDVLNGQNNDDQLLGGQGRDILRGERGRDLLNGGNGNDVLNGQNNDDQLLGGRGRDVLRGGRGRDRLRGQDGNDRLNGNGQNDRLIAGDGRDRLSGGAGNDFLKGNQGNDVLIGGRGRDTFAIGLRDGVDRILDLNVRREQIMLLGRRLTVDDLTFRSRGGGDNTLIQANGDNLVFLLDVTVEQVETRVDTLFI